MEFLTTGGKQKVEQGEKENKTWKTVQAAYKGVEASLLRSAATLTGAFFSIRHAAGQANPGLLQAFDGALGILQARLAGALLPAIDWVIDSVMEAADWFQGLSEGTKKLLAGGMVAVPLVVGLGSALMSLSPALKLVWIGIKKLKAEAKQNMAISALAGVATVASIAAIAIWNMDRKAGPSSNTSQEIRSRAGTATEAEMRSLRFTDEQIQHLTSGDQKQVDSAADAIRRQNYRRTEWQAFFHPEAYKEQRDTAESLLQRIQSPSIGAVSDSLVSDKTKVKNQAMRVSAMQQENRPQYSALSEARKQLQLQILGKNRYEQEILKEQRKHREEEINRLDQLITEFRQRHGNARPSD